MARRGRPPRSTSSARFGAALERATAQFLHEHRDVELCAYYHAQIIHFKMERSRGPVARAEEACMAKFGIPSRTSLQRRIKRQEQQYPWPRPRPPLTPEQLARMTGVTTERELDDLFEDFARELPKEFTPQ